MIATLCGLGAILLWALLALFTAATETIPPFQLTAMTFGIAFLCALVKWLVTKQKLAALFRQPLALWGLGVGGLFGYHAFYFIALKNAPAAEASLIAYLWPLLIILFSTLLPSEKFHWYHLVGGLVSLAGAGILITKGARLDLEPEYMAGYGAAILCAFIWSGYSVLSRKFAAVSTDVIGLFCGATALLAVLVHLLFEQTIWPQDLLPWLAVLGLGLGPVGAAFFLWDRGMKLGDIQTLGVLSYLSPLLSTIILVGMGVASLSASLVLGCLMITLGALIGSYEALMGLIRRSR
ncbi:DMT family transporter [Sneathiella marina]|uniref:DMT family transporter n=1 Tax=Sneathiella marina TaxID=2950108 RepID=A0ABY4W289_9PROT|nr:DMT family transporter [Sneathiella marina]USG61087.1 DMT family transporter [Sneathiella marina]